MNITCAYNTYGLTKLSVYLHGWVDQSREPVASIEADCAGKYKKGIWGN